MDNLLTMGLRALGGNAWGDPAACAVFGDAVLEAGWFDARVMPLLYPPAKVNPYASSKERMHRRAALAKQVPIMHSREHFDAAAGRGSSGFVRACVAVMLFGGWQKGRWQVKATMLQRRKREERAALADYRRGLDWGATSEFDR